jgi:cell division protein FtsB
LALQATNKRLHQENTQLNADVARLASIAQTLIDEIARLRAVAAGKVSEMVKQSPP